MRPLALLALLLLVACRREGETTYLVDRDDDGFKDTEDCDDDDATVGLPTDWFADADGDGYGAGAATNACDAPDGTVASSDDCNDADATIHPSATEFCDGIDQDCDGVADNGLQSYTYYVDADQDGYGDDATAATGCEVPAGLVEQAGDCNDQDAAYHPGAEESCTDPADYNCDGSTGYDDNDGDGWAACDDCRDDDPDSFPGAAESCDGVDNDCDTEIDEDAIDGTTWYRDLDGDRYGDASSTTTACSAPAGYVADYTDCDDTTADVNPGEPELCNGRDDNCNGLIDDSPIDATTWYADADGDGYGSDTTTTAACEQPAGYSAYGGDCDDSDPAYNPGAVEDDCLDPNDYNCDGSVGYADADGDGYAACEECDDSNASNFPGAAEYCDGEDNDCDGDVDEDSALDASSWYADADTDTYGDPAVSVTACDPPSGFVADSTDCDDTTDRVNPGEIETCDGIDNDCDGEVDTDAADMTTWYRDADADSYGDGDDTSAACATPEGYVANDDDCDDTNAAISPDATEMCDTIDNDCDFLVDEDDSADASTFYRDADGDSYGDPLATDVDCYLPPGYVENADDCDDSRDDAYPGADETCNGEDDDCDGEIDEGATDFRTYYIDADGDGFGDSAVTTVSCSPPSGYVADGTDCDDTLDTVYPGAPELCDLLDNDCDTDIDEGATSTYYVDADGDGHGTPDRSVVECGLPEGYSADALDCDDSDPTVYGGADELCDELDNDCDGNVDEGLDSTYYLDADADGYGASDTATVTCDPDPGYVLVPGDCDDTDAAIHPGATELCDELDNDCDGATDEGLDSTYYEDTDGDGYGASSTATVTCDPDPGYVLVPGDCDDTDAAVNPSATEICDAIDNDCDSATDEGFATTLYADDDDDGYGDPSASLATTTCSTVPGYVSDANDCDDTDAAINPAAAEVCDPADTDEDCNGWADDADPGVTDQVSWYTDADGDGYGAETSTAVVACDAPAGRVADNTDCDDTDPAIYPGAYETWDDGIDSDCNGVDDGDICLGLPDAGTTAADATCEATLGGSWDLVTEWSTDAEDGWEYSEGADYTHVMMTPAVGQLSDDNGDGAIDDLDMPDIAYTTFSGGGYYVAGYLRVVSGDGSGSLLDLSYIYCGGNYYVHGAAGVTIADIDDDGSPDILTMTSSGRVLALEYDGTCKWVSSTATYQYNAPTVADLDGDGDPEVIVGNHVYGSGGGVVSTNSCSTTGISNIAADIDRDGNQEVVCGAGAFTRSGSTEFTMSLALAGVGNLNTNRYGEVINVGTGRIAAYSYTGALLWNTVITGVNGGGSPFIGDIDGDGEEEIVVGFDYAIVAVDNSGTEIWRYTVDDDSSRVAGVSGFDFDGDGDYEVVYADEGDLYIFDGDGTVLAQESGHASGTLWEYPLVADVDNDGNAEIVVASNDYAFEGWDGIRVIGELNDSWSNARNTWNQFAYGITNIEDDMSVPPRPTPPWADSETFRAQTISSDAASAASAPDLGLQISGVCEDCASDLGTVYVAVSNSGAMPIKAGLPIAVYANDGGVYTLIGTGQTTEDCEPGEVQVPVGIAIALSDMGTDGIHVVVDDDGTGAGIANECDESDNSADWDASTCP